MLLMISKTIMTMLLLVMAVGAISMTYAATTFFGDDCSINEPERVIDKICNDLNNLNDRVVSMNSTINNLVDPRVSITEFRNGDLAFYNVDTPRSLAGANHNGLLSSEISLFAVNKIFNDGTGAVNTLGTWYLHEGAIVELFRYDGDLFDHETICTLTENQTMSDCNPLILTPEKPMLGYSIIDLGNLVGTADYYTVGIDLMTFGDP